MRILLLLLLFPLWGQADVAPVAVRLPEAKAWIGQRVPFFVELRSPGSFAGSASFDLPQLPGTLLMKLGNPVVGSQEIEGATWFVQTHEFALFSQKPGALEVPAFTVRFAQRDGFTGPASDVKAESPGFKVEIQRPSGSANVAFLITTESLDVTEMWNPAPGPAEVGAIFKRTIVQRAPQVPGMALAPAPASAPDGVRVYPGNAETNDKLERGDFLGERRETITYMMQHPGTLELPELNYVWWNPKTETLESKTLPAAAFEIAPPPTAPAQTETGTSRRVWLWLLGAVAFCAFMVWQKRRLAEWVRQCWKILNPPDRVAARKLLRACHRNDATAAATAWTAWQNTQEETFQPKSELRAAVIGLQRHQFGPMPTDTWQGIELARAFAQKCSSATARPSRKAASSLPPLNPRY